LEKNKTKPSVIVMTFKGASKILVWFVLMLVMYASNYAYFEQVRFESEPSVPIIVAFNVVFAVSVYLAVRESSFIGGIVGLALVYSAVNTSIASDARWQRKKYLFYNYVVDFSYDKYCPLSIEDKFIMEEISIYGITDCDDAKIPYKKLHK
jgi:hypothetical protein